MDSIIEILVGLAFIAVPAIFRWIGKSFENAAGQPMQQTSVPDELEQIFQEWNDMQPEEQQQTPVYKSEDPAPALEIPVSVKPSEKVLRKPVKPVEETDVRQKKQKIDPKKLVVYSEIMKPKYTE